MNDNGPSIKSRCLRRLAQANCEIDRRRNAGSRLLDAEKFQVCKGLESNKVVCWVRSSLTFLALDEFVG
jgi:hypothetical protein